MLDYKDNPNKKEISCEIPSNFIIQVGPVEILDYLKRFVRFRHFKNITVPCIEEHERHFLRNGFIKKGFNLEWRP